ncbi:MAG: starch-binding protein, partial [Paludibacteraceae bacterium]|nr:starch-binding protein [Paludibacteraceae bacterium]
GTGTQTDASTYTYGSTVTVKPQGSVTRTGYTFGGWNTNSSGTGTNYTAGTGTFSITGNTTLYAKWTENKHNVTISYKCGSTTIKDNTTQNNVSEAVATSGITAASINGYTFSSWTVGTGVQITTGTTSSSTISIKTLASGNYTLTANYTQDNYTVTVNSVGGEISAPSGGSLTNKHYGDNVTITAVNPDALTFVGWTASPAANATIANASLLSTTATIKGNVTLTATFRVPITVYFSNEQCWSNVALYAFSSNDDTKLPAGMNSWPGIEVSQNEDGWWYYTFDKDITTVKVIFNNNNGGSQTNNIGPVTETKYYKIDASGSGFSETTSSYSAARCIPDVYTVVGDAALVGSSWDTGDGANEMTWNASNSRYELKKMNVSISTGSKYYKFVKNHCYTGSSECGQWPYDGSNKDYYFNTAQNYDLTFWLKPGGDALHPDLDNTCGLDVATATTYAINHPWGGGGWSQKQMTYSGSGSTFVYSGEFGGDGANINSTWFAPSSITGYSIPSVGDVVTFTYDASANTLTITCPTCDSNTPYWIRVPASCNGAPTEQFTKMTYNVENGLYYTDPTVASQAFKWPNNGAAVNTTKEWNDNWIDRNDIVNYASMSSCALVQYIYDPDINQLTVVDANTPQITLTATQAVNAAATESVITLRTTSTKTLTNATYSYSKISGPDGTLAASTTNTTTFTTTNEGTYNFRVTVSSDQGTFTANCTVRVKFKITVYANVAAPNWTGTINLYYWATGVTAANHAMTSVGGKWYKYEVKGVPEFSFIVRNNTGSGNAQTVDIGPIDDDICIVVSSNIQSGGSSRLYSVTTDCELYMRFASTYTQMKGEQNTGVTKTVYSNLFKQNGDQVSFYVGSTPNVKFQTFNSASDKWNAGTTVLTGVSGGDVYAGEYNSSASNKLKNFATYTGEFYVRTDGAPGGWSNYKLSSQAFFQFSRNDYYPNEWYNHYWCKWTGSGTNVKVCVANEINPSVTDTLPDFYLTMNTNMRFEYDNETNYIGRQFLKGSGAGSDYLRIYASDDDTKNFIYLHDSSNTRIKKDNASTFTDMSDWVYLIDVYAKPTGSDVNVYVLGRYPVTRTGIGAATDQDNNLGGYDDDGVTPLSIKIMGFSTTPDTYNMRLIYDYKTNRLMAAWYPQGNDVAGAEVTVDANFMLSRENDEEAETVGMTTNNGKIVSINQMIAALTITRSAYNTRKSTGNYYYWVSLPYDVYIRDIYGIGSYGKKWVVQRYRGDMRAKYGFLNTIETFWANMKQNATAKMEANRGYVIRVQLTDDDFKEIDGRSQVTLYFPSCNTEDIQLKNSTTALQTSVPEHLCEVVEPNGDPRKNWDSHWNVIGQPGLVTSAITVPTSVSGENEEEYRHHPKYYYKWSWSGGQGVYTPTAVSGTDNAFLTMYAYMVQYGGQTITWQPNIETIDPSLAPRRRTTTEQKDLIISLTATAEREIEHITGEDLHSEFEQVTDFDRILLTLSEQGTDNFVLNQDMSKTKSGKLNIYTVFDKTNTAGKVIPMNTKEVPVIVEINYENEVIFALDKEISKKTITFVDYSEGTETILNSSEYKVNLPAGKYDKRFAIRISERTEIPTDIAETANNGDSEIHLLRDGQQLYFEGLTDSETLRMFDATGKCLMSTTISNGEHFGVPSQGMYLLQVGTQTFKVAIN